MKDNQKLTPKQEAAVHEYMKNGGNKSAAYRHAYNTGNMKESTINVKACELFKEGKVSVRVEALQEEVRKDSIADIQEIKEFFTNTLREEVNDMKDRTKLCKLTNDDLFTKLQILYDSAEKSQKQKRN